MGDSRIRAAASEIAPDAIIGLIRAGAGEPGWARRVWEFYEDSLHLIASDVFPVWPKVPIPVRMTSVFKYHLRRDFEERFGIRLLLNEEEGAIEFLSGSEAEASAATAAIEGAIHAPRRSAMIAKGVGGWLLGNERKNLLSLQGRAGISYVWIDGEVGSIMGNSQQAVDAAMRELTRPATGILVVPSKKKWDLMGEGGLYLRALQDMTGCSADNPAKDETFIVKGASAEAIEHFFMLARSKVPGSTGRVTSLGSVAYLPDPPHYAARGRRIEPQFQPAVFDLRELSELAAIEASAADRTRRS